MKYNSSISKRLLLSRYFYFNREVKADDSEIIFLVNNRLPFYLLLSSCIGNYLLRPRHYMHIRSMESF